MTVDSTTDRALLEAWRGGDEAAGNTLLERHFGTVLRFLRASANLGRPELTEMVQRTMVACVESRERIPDEVSFRAYLLGIARRQLSNAYREAHRAEARAKIIGPQASLISPSAVVAARQEEQLLLRALQRIPSELQVVILLFYWEQLTTPEIAAVCELPTGTVKSRLRRAREQLEREMRALTEDVTLYNSTVRDFEKWALSLRKRIDEPI
ncbi:MAG: RNA polymerase sigma factor [Nannocystales bacterium]